MADYDHRAGGQLLVRSPGALTRVVGTLFSVKAGATGSRIVVARGRVAGHGRARSGAQRWRPATRSAPTRGRPSAGRAKTAGRCRSTPARTPDGRRPVSRRRHPRTRPARQSAAAPASAARQRPAGTSPQRPRRSRVAADRPGPGPSRPLPAPPARPRRRPRSRPVPHRRRAARPRVAAGPAPAGAHPRPRPCTSGPSRPCAAATGPPPAGNWPRWSRSRTGHPLEDVARYELAQLALRAGGSRPGGGAAGGSAAQRSRARPALSPPGCCAASFTCRRASAAGPPLPGALPRHLPRFAARRGGAGPADRELGRGPGLRRRRGDWRTNTCSGYPAGSRAPRTPAGCGPGAASNASAVSGEPA